MHLIRQTLLSLEADPQTNTSRVFEHHAALMRQGGLITGDGRLSREGRAFLQLAHETAWRDLWDRLHAAGLETTGYEMLKELLLLSQDPA